MDEPTQLHCSLVGESALLIRCAGQLLDRGHTLHSLVTCTETVIQWAQAHGFPVIHPLDDLASMLGTQPFDYLFSVANQTIIPREVLLLPRLGAIHYHDGPLPAYAGLHVTSWALINREKTYGITWRRLVDKLDSGAVLKQRLFEVAADETAYTLNAKCQDAGVAAFGELIDELASGQMVEIDPHLAEQTRYKKFERPPAAQIIRWDQTAEAIEALVRALDFGDTPNPLGLPKLRVGGYMALVRRAEISPSLLNTSPGTVVALDEQGITLATAAGDIAIRALLSADGQPLALRDFARAAQLEVGSVVETLDAATADDLTAYHRAIVRHEAFWLSRLASLTPAVPPYLDRNSAAVTPLMLELPRALLHVVGGEVSAQDVLIAAFAGYLARLSGRYHFDLGWRVQDEPGDFDNLYSRYVPLRVDLKATSGGLAVLTEVLETLATIKVCHTYPRDLVARYPELRPLIGGARYPVIVDYAASPADYVLPAGSALALLLTAEGDCFVYQGVDGQRLTRSFQIFMENLVKGLSEPLGLLPLLTAEDLRRLFIEWNDTDAPVPAGCLHDQIEQQAARTPDAVAVVFEEIQITYEELNQRANQLARHLHGLGVRPDVPVGLCIERSVDMVVALLGILKAGGAYVPLDRTRTPEHIGFILRDCEIPVLVTQSHLMSHLPESAAQVVCIDTHWPAISAHDDTHFDSGVLPENLSYIHYTTDPVNLPHGVQVEHRNVVNFFTGMDQHVQHDPPGVWLALTGLASDVSVLELLWTLARGFKVVIAHDRTPEADSPNEGQPDSFAILVERHGVTHLQCTPAAAARFLEQAENASALGYLRQILVGGELFPASLAQALRTRMSGEILNLYGSTEATIWSSAYLLDGLSECIPIGRPIANTVIYLLDAWMQPVPAGLPGELFIGGQGVARGYLNRPDLNADRFVADPFGKERDARLYRTGDVARYLPDGTLEWVGRVDPQTRRSPAWQERPPRRPTPAS